MAALPILPRVSFALTFIAAAFLFSGKSSAPPPDDGVKILRLPVFLLLLFGSFSADRIGIVP
jgi:hypothetical protein